MPNRLRPLQLVDRVRRAKAPFQVKVKVRIMASWLEQTVRKGLRRRSRRNEAEARSLQDKPLKRARGNEARKRSEKSRRL